MDEYKGETMPIRSEIKLLQKNSYENVINPNNRFDSLINQVDFKDDVIIIVELKKDSYDDETDNKANIFYSEAKHTFLKFYDKNFIVNFEENNFVSSAQLTIKQLTIPVKIVVSTSPHQIILNDYHPEDHTFDETQKAVCTPLEVKQAEIMNFGISFSKSTQIHNINALQNKKIGVKVQKCEYSYVFERLEMRDTKYFMSFTTPYLYGNMVFEGNDKFIIGSHVNADSFFDEKIFYTPLTFDIDLENDLKEINGVNAKESVIKHSFESYFAKFKKFSDWARINAQIESDGYFVENSMNAYTLHFELRYIPGDPPKDKMNEFIQNFKFESLESWDGKKSVDGGREDDTEQRQEQQDQSVSTGNPDGNSVSITGDDIPDMKI